MKKSSSGSPPRLAFFAGAATLLVAGSVCLWESPARAAGSATLTFDVSARASQEGGSGQIVNAHVLLSGQKARVETRLGQQPSVILWLRPYVYRLLPQSKTGVRYKSTSPMPEMQLPLSQWPQVMNDPGKIRGLFTARGARKTGSQTVDGVAADLYTAKTWKTAAGNVSDFKIWLRRSDALPVKMESRSGGLKFAVKWRNYHRGVPLAASLFAVPKGYKIREGAPPRSSF